MTEPLPLVPATWMTGGRRRSGWPRRSSSRQVRSRDRSMILGCSLVSRSRTRSLSWAVLVDARLGMTVAAGGNGKADHLGGRRRVAEKIDDADHGVAQLAARHDHVDHPMIAQIFGALESLRQLLADRLLDHPRPGYQPVAHRAAHGAAHEIEIEGCDHRRQAAHSAVGDDDGVLLAGLGLGLAQAIGIALGV